MADNLTTKKRIIPFEHLIGGPLKASIDAQTIAARATIDFIQKVGFTSNEDIIDDNTGLPKDNFSYGDVRNISFYYYLTNEFGTEE